MAVSGHLLILLIPVLSLCGATEYYVRPTEPTNTSCPAQPCLTLNQYVNDSDNYFQSNTVFKFLPGIHHMDRPATICNVHNISLESFSEERPHLVAQFFNMTMKHDCLPVSAWIYSFNACCAAIWLHDVHNVTVKGLIVTVQTPNVSGVIMRNGFNGTVHLTTTYSSYRHYCFGIAIYDADYVEVGSSSVNNCTYGLILRNTTNNHISDVTAMYNMLGVVLMEADDSFITNTIVTNNTLEGLYFGTGNNTCITNTTAICSDGHGMHLMDMNNSHIIYTTTSHNGKHGMVSETMRNTSIIYPNTSHNGQVGMYLSATRNTSIVNTTATWAYIGISLISTNNTNIINATAT